MFVLLSVFVLGTASRAAEPVAVTPEAAAFFEKEVRPLLVEHCYRCHGEKKQRHNLRLDTLAAILRGGDGGPALVAGKPEESILIKAVRYQDGLKMPPDKPLPKHQIDALAKWVAMGAPWPGAGKVEIKRNEFTITDKDREHWSFRPVHRPSIPTVKANLSVANPIDAFIVARLEAQGIAPSAPAGKRELIRRVTFDLVGLPPSPEEIEAFVNDPSPTAYEKLVDRLLASPAYGERWGRHWLDVVRFAQSNGYERDGEKPTAWRYRDYVIQSLNQDKPFDQFVKEQLAADEMEAVTPETRIATVFYHLGVWDDEPDDARQAEFDNLDDMLATSSEAFLGLTLGCARCHDHKFDPLAQEDYYSLLAFLRGLKPYAGAKGTISGLLNSGGVFGVSEVSGTPPETHVLLTGQAARRGKLVEPRFLRVLCRTDADAKAPTFRPTATTSGRRRALADWIATRDNPLTARVIVNRLWHWHFGRGLAATPSDLGRNGSPPSHPELIDWLAAELVEGGWQLKRIQKMIVLSNTYRQSSKLRDDRTVTLDPGNVLLWRQNLRRLEAEAIRDAVLSTSGQLNRKAGGRGVFPTLPREVLETQSRPGDGWNTSPPAEQGRRSVYVFVKRTLGVPLLDAFDFAGPDKSVATRTTTTIAPQALILLNSSFMEEQSAAFADRLLKEDRDPAHNVEHAFRLALGRAPTKKERQIALGYLARSKSASEGLTPSLADRQALAGLCKLILNLNEFVYID
jgi:hypothetical protein